jgi:hypothetical protein
VSRCFLWKVQWERIPHSQICPGYFSRDLKFFRDG